MAEKDPLRIVLIGGTRRTLRTFQAILSHPSVSIIFAIFQRDFPWDEQWHDHLEELAIAHNIPFETCDSMQALTPELIDRIRSLRPDAIIGGGNWRARLPPAFWETSKYGYLGLHGSLLPEYRGFANLNWYIINGESQYGMQMYQLDKDIDNGQLVFKRDGTPLRVFVSLDEERNMGDILEEVEQRHVETTMELIDCLQRDDISFVPQDERRATWTCHRGPEDGEIDWNQPSTTLHDFIRAQSHPYTGAFSFYQNKKFHIWRTSIPKNVKNFVGRIPGKIVERHANGLVDVLTRDSVLRIEEITVDGEAIVPRKFLNSVRQKLGYNPRAAIENLERRIELLE